MNQRIICWHCMINIWEEQKQIVDYLNSMKYLEGILAYSKQILSVFTYPYMIRLNRYDLIFLAWKEPNLLFLNINGKQKHKINLLTMLNNKKRLINRNNVNQNMQILE